MTRALLRRCRLAGFALLALALAPALPPPPPAAASAVVDYLPPEVERLIKKHGINKNKLGLLIKRVDGTVLAAHQVNRQFNPASVTKLLTALAALDILGAGHVWKTTIAKRGTIKNGVLKGDLLLIGGGDPYLTTGDFLYMLNELRNRGVRDIRGNLLLDDSIFNLPPHDPAAFDGAPLRAYNVGAGGLVVNFKAQRVVFSAQGNRVRVYADPPNAHFRIDNKVTLAKGSCRNWRRRIKERLVPNPDGSVTFRLSGKYNARCGTQDFNISVLEHDVYVAGVFAALWERLGGTWQGGWKKAVAPKNLDKADVLVERDSPPLPQLLAAMNKHSNNLIARNVFLSLASGTEEPPYTAAAAQRAMQNWLHGIGLPDVVVENGSGLSRRGRITPAQMIYLLEAAWRHPYRAELIGSLPILGTDGTLRKRLKKSLEGEAHLKTGSLAGISTISGFLRDKSGNYLIITLFSEKQAVGRVKNLQDDLIKWAHATTK